MRYFKFFVSDVFKGQASIILVLSLLSGPVFGKDLTRRLGIGFINQFSTTNDRPIPSISAKYGFTQDLNGLVSLGFYTASPAGLSVGSKLFKNIFYETYLNFYAAMGFAFINDVKSSFEFLGVLGAEFFIPGLDSLGLSFESGISASNVTGSFAIKTVGFTFLNAGMHFYF